MCVATQHGRPRTPIQALLSTATTCSDTIVDGPRTAHMTSRQCRWPSYPAERDLAKYLLGRTC
ncbi:hypothetical protein KIN20_032745 [Parelaphostrongylus tenuis]|uniref:Uncharacterized protein n=1 Tax=Parelaphostrongylus tenuis TaxID=148309 RepID=A0AAD5R9C9_PARTN|nr:hypothetical protein KIN20_032745 [Parelaphostrongylus tenuis]